jgi:hypothetical protein
VTVIPPGRSAVPLPAFPASNGPSVAQPAQPNGAPPPPPAPNGAPPAALPGGVEHLPQPGTPVAGPHGEHVVVEGHEDEGNPFHGFYFTGDYLLLKPRRNAFDFAVVSPDRTTTPGGNVADVQWDTDSGYRLATGFALPGHDWSVGFTYTYLHTHGGGEEVAPAGGALFATLTRGGSFDQVDSAVARASFNYNVFDVDLSHKFKCHESFDLVVFGGGRFAWIDQSLSAVYNGGPDKATNDTVTSPVTFQGAGLTIGSEGLWNFYHGLGIYARARGSLLSGTFHNTLTETANNGTVSIVNVNERYQQIVPVAEMGMGLSYCGEHWHLSVGYELANWFNMVNSVDFPDSSNIGKVGRRTSDLSLEGLAVQLGLAF